MCVRACMRVRASMHPCVCACMHACVKCFSSPHRAKDNLPSVLDFVGYSQKARDILLQLKTFMQEYIYPSEKVTNQITPISHLTISSTYIGNSFHICFTSEVISQFNYPPSLSPLLLASTHPGLPLPPPPHLHTPWPPSPPSSSPPHTLASLSPPPPLLHTPRSVTYMLQTQRLGGPFPHSLRS